MKRINIFFLILLLFLTINTSFSNQSNFTAYFTGEQETPQVSTNARGTAAVTFTANGGVTFTITVNGLSGPITGARFHYGPIGIAGPIVLDITSNFIGTTATGVWNNIPDSLLRALMTEKLYLNVYTASHPNGEIRGQLFHSSGTGLSAKMTSMQVVPSLNLGTKGSAAMTLMSPGLVYHITINGLTGPVTGAQFRYGAIGINGPIVKDITSDFNNSNIAEGIWKTTGSNSLNDTLINALLTGKIYLNVQTSANPGGELRGQVEVSSGFPFGASINGSQEIPPVTTNGKGTGYFLLTDYGLIFRASVDSLSGPITGVHFHNAATGTTGPIVRDLMPELNGKTVTGIWKPSDTQPFTPQLMQELFKGNIYINFFTNAHPAGEIRGQVNVKVGSTFSAKLEGSQEVPISNTAASGSGTFTVTSSGLAFEITITGMTEMIATAHFFYGSVRESGTIVKTITPLFNGNTVIGTWGFSDPQPFNDSLYKALFDGKIYVNVVTPSAPAGLIRGQLRICSGAGFAAIMEGNQEVPSINTGAKGTAAFTLTPNGLIYDITVNGLSGAITGANFRYAPAGVSGPIVKDITPNINGNRIHGLWNELTMGSSDSLYRALATGRIYVNVQTAANPNGEIRGQIMLSEGIGLVAQLDGAQETPPVNTHGKGSSSASLTDAGLIFFSSVDSLSGPVTAVHFHNAPSGSPGSIVRDLFSTLDPVNNKNIKGIWRETDNQSLTDFLKSETVGNNIYLNFHTSANPNGEIRGQMLIGDALRIGIKAISNEIPKDFSLSQNYPNPFNPSTTIMFSVPQTSVVKLRLFDVLGRETALLLNKELKPGSYEYKFDASGMASGVYFYRLETSGFTDVKKMVLVK